ncbi:uncharacterized protein FIBRA_03413 [Fibroporia radiculosa]|uniref:DUF7330 domain-containing protein n=1 Tax=Fibroporia radiculosa TaxID=599839 RepID=J4G5D7_9APHY|nr:uncharacterized protein FIBRA_03413 [Fibroporia radiculosa]CCM01363.1 predicted protein [Fibroporia radiculosa]
MIILDPHAEPIEEKKFSGFGSQEEQTSEQNADAPPPYEQHARSSSLGEGSSAPLSSSPPLPPLPPPSPPPASPLPPFVSPSTAPTIPAAQQAFRATNRQRVNHISLFSRHDAISGSYLVDPKLPAASLNADIFSSRTTGKTTTRDRSVDRYHARNTRRAFGAVPGEQDDSASEDKRSWLKRRTRMPEVNAAFRTRHGAIKLDLAIVGSGTTDGMQQKSKRTRGRVMVASRHGRINVDLYEIQSDHCVDLDVSTRHGKIAVFLPPTFTGVVSFHRHGGPSGIHFLPEFASRARTVRASDGDVLVTLTSPIDTSSSHSDYALPREGEDCCVIGTRHGKITVGISGVDQLPDKLHSSGGGLISRFEALVDAGTKQFETMVEAGAKGFENWVEAKAKALEGTLTGRA